MGDAAVCLEVAVDLGSLGCKQEVNDGCSSSESVHERDTSTPLDCMEPATCMEQAQHKEASNEDMKSEVFNPIISPTGNASSCLDITSQPSQVGSGDATSECSRDMSQVETMSDEGEISCVNPTTSLTPAQSHVTLEIPEHASTTGVRKITLKFSKRKEDYDDFRMVSQSVAEGSIWESSLPEDVMLKSDDDRHASGVESVAFAKNVPSCYPTNVKKLLLTGILNGAKVKYISRSQKLELDGYINSGGYLCSCSSCNFTKVLSAYEFEQHAGAKTKHPNNHIYLENGKPIYNIIQELKTAPLSMLDEVIKSIAGSAVNDRSFQMWKATLEQSNANSKPSKRRSHFLVSQSSNHLAEGYSPKLSSFTSVGGQKYVDNVEGEHAGLKRPSNSSNSATKQNKTSEYCAKRSRRDNDLHRLLFMPNGLPDGVELAYYAKGQKLLSGYKQGNGIVCGCCDTEVSPSQFEAHSGMAARRQPYRHIYTSNGLTLHDIAVSLLNGQSITAGMSDDMCSKCGNGGELVLCQTCPRAFHKGCVDSNGISDDAWQCPECCQCVQDGNSLRPIVIRSTRVVKAPEYEVGGCAVCRSHDFTPVVFDDRTVILCDQCEKEFHVGCLRERGICDLKEIPTSKWFCCHECKRIHSSLENVVTEGLQTVPNSQINIITKKHCEKGLYFDGGANFQLHFLKGSNHRPEDLYLLSATTAIFRECFDPIVAVTGRDLIPVMVHGRNISGQEFGGMYCILLTINAVVVSAGLLRIFGREVAELPLVATSRAHQGKGYFQALFACVENLLCSLNVENLVLPAAEEAESIWTKKFGFRKITDDRMTEYSKYQLTIFKGTSMLEKQVLQTNLESSVAAGSST